jgi:hypothetical protein
MIEFTDNNNKLRRITEYTMEEWNGNKWVTTEDYTPEDEWEDNPADLDDVVDRMMCDSKYHDDIVGWF